MSEKQLLRACQHCLVPIVEAEVQVTGHDGTNVTHSVWMSSNRLPFCPGFPKGYQVKHKLMPIIS